MKNDAAATAARKWYDNLVAGNLDAVIEGLAEDVDWDLPLNDGNRIIPYLGKCKGRQQVAEAFRKRAESIAVEHFEVRDFVFQDDHGCAVIYTRGVCRRTGRSFEVEDVHRIVVNSDGKIGRWKAYFDPFTEVAAFSADLEQQLLGAVEQNDVAAAQRCVEFGANVNARDSETGLTALMLAACRANAAMVKLLLDAGADPLTTDSKTGATPLHKACQGGNVEVARLLVEKGAFVDAVTPTMGHTPIMDALWYKWPAVVQYLVDQGANLHLSTHYGFSMMEHFQFELNVNTKGKDKLLEIDAAFKKREKADADAVAKQTVMEATAKGDTERALHLIGQKEDVNTLYPHRNTFLDGHTPLLVAARDGHTEIVEALLQAGAKVRVEDWVFKGAPIHKATYNGKPDILRLILDHPDVDIDVQGPINGYTPLHDALWHGYTECADMLLEAGARLDLKGHDGKTPLDIAISVYGPDADLVNRIRDRMAKGL